MRFKHQLMLGGALVASAFAVDAHAQARAGAAAAATNTIEELVVTAEKREQNLQDVPVAVSAFTANKREIVGINSIQDMTNFTPGLSYNSSTDRISLRGVGRLTNVLTADSSVANYNDGIYETFAVQAGRSTLFLDRVEILRGPQGTLYGRNAIGGAINEVSKLPTEDWFAEIRGSYANYDHATVEGAVSGPFIIPGMQFRLAGDWDRQTKGWVKNVIPGEPDLGGVINEWFIEGQLQGKFFDDKLDFWAKYGMGVWHNGTGGPGAQADYWTNGPYPNYEFASAGIQINPGYACNPLSGATNVVNASPLGCTNPSFDPNGLSKKAARTVARLNGYTVTLPLYNTEAIHLTWHAKDFDIRYLTGGVNYHYQLDGETSGAGGTVANSADAPVLAFNLATGLRVLPQETFRYREFNRFWSHEINIVSTWDSPLQYVIGGYYFKQHVRQPVNTELVMQPQWNGPFAFPTAFCAATGGVCAPESGFHRYDNQPQSQSTSYAGFGQIDWKMTPEWKLTAGLRYSHDQKSGSEAVRILCWGTPTCGIGPAELYGPAGPQATDITAFAVFNPPPGTPLPPGITTPVTTSPTTGLASRSYDASWEATTGTFGVEWQPDTGTNAYAKYSRGYRSGGFYVGIFTFLAPNALAAKETVDSYEIGLKKDFGPKLQTNLAAYYYSYTNLQVPIGVISTSGMASTNFYNVPKSVSEGIEAEVTWLPPIDNLQILVSYSYNHTRIDSGTAQDLVDPSAIQPGAQPIGPAKACAAAVPGDAPCDPWTGLIQRTQSLAGQRLPNAPENKLAINANYTLPEVQGGSLVASVSYIYRDVQYGTLFTRSYNKSPDWDQWDARLTWTSKDSRDRVIAFAKNITNSLGFDAGALGARYAGSIINPATLATTLVNQGIFKSYSITPPRTFGIEVQHKFF
jgi:iron complex outermembrane receptor protein